MEALLVAVLAAGSTFAAVWPVMAPAPTRTRVVLEERAPARQARRVQTIRVIRGTSQRACSSPRRPCVRRRVW
jgi:hypothetical protein